MIVKRRKRITVEAADDGELEERLAVLLDAMTAHGAEILRIERLATPVGTSSTTSGITIASNGPCSGQPSRGSWSRRWAGS